LLLKAFLVLPLMGLGLRWLGYARLHNRLTHWRPSDKIPAQDQEGILTPRAQATARMVQAAARYGLYRPNCLPQSLALWWLLKRQGIPGVLRIGVSPLGERLEAHAWVEFGGRVLNDGEDASQRFAPFHEAIIAPPVQSPPGSPFSLRNFIK
jgi:hypothetical protein